MGVEHWASIKRLQVRLPLRHCWCNNLTHVVHTLVPLYQRPLSEEAYSVFLPVLATIVM